MASHSQPTAGNIREINAQAVQGAVPQLQMLATEIFHSYRGWLVVFAILVSVELLAPRERQPLRCRAMGLAYWTIWIPASAVIAVLLSAAWARIGLTPLLSLAAVQSNLAMPRPDNGIAILVGVLVGDFAAYWCHRAQHAWLWPFHAVHHSIRNLNAVNSYHHISEKLFTFLLAAAPASLVSSDIAGTIPLLALLQWLQGVYLHSPSRLHLGPLRHIFADNRFHRIHHSLEQRHFDKNFGILFSFWDRMFGTAHAPARDEWPDVGLAEVDEPRSVREWFDLPLRLLRAQRGTTANAETAVSAPEHVRP